MYGLLSSSIWQSWAWSHAYGEQGLWFTDFTATEPACCLAHGWPINIDLRQENEVCLTQNSCSWQLQKERAGWAWAEQSKARGCKRADLWCPCGQPPGVAQQVSVRQEVSCTQSFSWIFLERDFSVPCISYFQPLDWTSYWTSMMNSPLCCMKSSSC